MSRAQAQKERANAWLAFLLAWVGGAVDAIGYLTLLHVFTAHMSGNTAALGAHIGQREWSEAFQRAFPIPVFVLGVALGAALTEAASSRGVRSPFSLALGLEAILLFAFLWFVEYALRTRALRPESPWIFYPLMALPVLAMGLQNATLRKVGGQIVRTTYITGMLTMMAEEGVAYLFWLWDRTRGRPWGRLCKALRAAPRHPAFNQVVLLAGIWIAFAVGAILGSYAERLWQLQYLALPLAGIVVVLIRDLLVPIVTPQEQEARPGDS